MLQTALHLHGMVEQIPEVFYAVSLARTQRITTSVGSFSVHHIAPELYDNVAAYASYPGYTPRQRLAIEYAERFATDHASMDDAFFGRLRESFSDAEILDLTLCVAVFLGLGRSLTVLGVDQSCAIDI